VDCTSIGHTVRTAAQEHWDTLQNGDLLTVAEHAGFEVFLTTDKNLRYQQNMSGRTIAVAVIPFAPSPSWRTDQGVDIVVHVNGIEPTAWILSHLLPVVWATGTLVAMLILAVEVMKLARLGDFNRTAERFLEILLEGNQVEQRAAPARCRAGRCRCSAAHHLGPSNRTPGHSVRREASPVQGSSAGARADRQIGMRQ
jgi:hypothetical protein